MTKLAKNIFFYVISAILSIVVIWYVLFHLFNGFEDKITTTPALLSSKTVDTQSEAYIFRDEYVLYSAHNGGVNYLFNDGDKVSVGTVVANIYSGSDVKELTEKIISIDKQIDLLEKSGVPENATQTDTATIDNKISNLVYIIRDKLQDGDIDHALYRKDELLVYLNKRNVITQSVTDYSSQILMLKNERQELSNKLTNLEEKITVDTSGYFYSQTDGYEDIFDMSLLNNCTLEEYYNIVDSSNSVSSPYRSVCKIVSSSEWCIATEVSGEDLRFYNTGNEYSVKFPYNADVIVKMTLSRIIRDSDTEGAVLVFKTDMMPEGFLYMRKQTVNIVKESYTGYKVPSNAVRVIDGVQGVYVLNGNTVRFKEISVLTEQDGFYIVSEQPMYLEDESYHKKLGLYDLIITSGKNLFDGKNYRQCRGGQMTDRVLTAEYKSYLKDNIDKIRSAVESAANSNSIGQEVTLLAATKTVPADVINYVTSELGITDIGENRVQELIDKYDDLNLDGVRLHFIGKLQTNKVKYIIDKVDMIHSLDSIKLAAEIDSRAKKINKIMDVLVEVNIGREVNKSGVFPEDVCDFIKKLEAFENIRVKGIMTIAPVCSSKEEYKKYFKETYSIFIDNLQNKLHNIDMESLSMGMSDSFVAAIEEGSNIVRIGSSIFGSRY